MKTDKKIAFENLEKIGMLKERERILKIINKWWNNLQNGDIDKYDVGFAEFYIEDLEKLKSQIKVI